MAKGDHLVVRFGAYTHHGIDLGNGNVIHYGRGLHQKTNARVEVVSRETFAGGNPVRIRQDAPRYSADEIVARAESRLGEYAYDLFDNNCEHFASWCRTGVVESSQVNLADAVYRRSTAVATKLMVPRLLPRLAARLRPRSGAPLALPAALAADAVQLSAETLALRSGAERERSKEIGRRSGALASSGFGYMLGGPAGAAVGFSSWLIGEMVGQTTSTTTRHAVRPGSASTRSPHQQSSRSK